MHTTDFQGGNPLLVSKLRRLMEATADGMIPFQTYMQLILYDPEHGYYTSARKKIGREGDFYTSSQIGDVMGRVLAAYIQKQAGSAESYEVTEWGAGTGRLARQILDVLKDLAPARYAKTTYTLVERSPYHRELQREALCEHLDRVRFRSPDETRPYEAGLVFSNELLDAFPVHRIRQRGEELMELCVGWDGQAARFQEAERPCTDGAVREYLSSQGIQLADGQTADVPMEAFRWIRSQAELLPPGGTLLSIDYGDRAEELYGSHRMAGTLMCYKEHRAHDNPYVLAGEQDLTAHVDFSGCIAAGSLEGLAEWRLMTQKEFLVENGVLGLLQAHAGADPFSPEAKRNRAVRQLLLSDQMSELFKVLIQRKPL